MASDKVNIDDLTCTHNVSIPDGYGGCTHIIVFIKDNQSYIWITGTNAYSDFRVGETYNIRATCDSTNRLARVSIRTPATKSEQPDAASFQIKQPVDVFNLIYNIGDDTK